MSESDDWAAVYDAWAGAMPEDAGIWHDWRRVFERVAASLRPGGRFAFNAFAFSHITAALLDGAAQPFIDESLEYVYVTRKP